MEVKRGDIFFVRRYENIGNEQAAGRPAIVVSNDISNTSANVFEVVYLTTQEKTEMPTHVTIRSSSKLSTALCEQITTAGLERLGNKIGSCTADEMERIDVALMISLGLSPVDTPKAPEKTPETEYIRLKAERDIYKEVVTKMLERKETK